MKFSNAVLIPVLGMTFLQACSEGPKQETNHIDSTKVVQDSVIIEEPLITKAPIQELTDTEYPDNPDISIRHQLDGTFSHKEVDFIRSEETKNFDVIFYPNNEKSDTILIKNINLLEWIPAIPEQLKENAYLTKIGIINQEWNRQQVKFRGQTFEVKGTNLESEKIVRVDLARNCLNSYLWEVIAYAKNEEGNEAPAYHGWFSFPTKLYSELYFERNNLKFDELKNSLVDWMDPEQKAINSDLLRTVIFQKETKFTSFNDKLYPLIGERKKKNINIIYPKNATTINDFLTDSTLYATFTPPGFYNTADPRKTELGRLAIIEKVMLSQITSINTAKTESIELAFSFKDKENKRNTELIIGGIPLADIPQLSTNDVHKGFQMPMGFANHSFYETVERLNETPSKENPYYAYLLDTDKTWLDSHKVGIDGPLFHFDEKDKNKLHIWILSFERHSFVGHFTVDLK